MKNNITKNLLKIFTPVLCAATTPMFCAITSCSRRVGYFYNDSHFLDFDEVQDLPEPHMGGKIDIRFRLNEPIVEGHSLEVIPVFNETIFPGRWGNFEWKKVGEEQPIALSFNTNIRHLIDCKIWNLAVPEVAETPVFYEGDQIIFFVILQEKNEDGVVVSNNKCQLKLIHRPNE